MALVSVGWSRLLGETKSVAVTLGGGVEIGYAWHWHRLVVELGSGALYARTIADTAPGAPPAGSWLPVVNVSLGYGW